MVKNNTSVKHKFNWENTINVFLMNSDNENKIFRVITHDLKYLSYNGIIKKVLFVDGFGKTPECAEENAWYKYNKYKKCDHSCFERRDIINGGGYCKKCEMYASQVFEPLTKCKKCGKATFFIYDKEGNAFCEKHAHKIPIKLKTSNQILAEKMGLLACEKNLKEKILFHLKKLLSKKIKSKK